MQFNYILKFTCRGSVIALGWANVAFRERGWKRRLKMGWVGRTLNRKTRGMFQKSGIELDCNEGTCRLSYLPDQRNSFEQRTQTRLLITTQSSIMYIYIYIFIYIYIYIYIYVLFTSASLKNCISIRVASNFLISLSYRFPRFVFVVCFGSET